MTKIEQIDELISGPMDAHDAARAIASACKRLDLNATVYVTVEQEGMVAEFGYPTIKEAKRGIK